MRLALILVLSLSITPALAAPGDLCWETDADMCGLLSTNPQDVFDSVTEPLDSQTENLGLVILWGGLLGIIWFKTENIMLLGIVGTVVSATITGLDETAQGIAQLLLAISVGILMFQLIRQRVSIIS